MQRYIVRGMQEHKGAPRVYLDMLALAEAGFEPGKTYRREVDEDKRRVVLSLEDNGTHVVSGKDRDGRKVPVIDINSHQALKAFEGMQAVRIVVEERCITILPLASEVKRSARLRRLEQHLQQGEVTTAGISFGGGVLDHAAHTGLKDAGLCPKLVMANEIDEALLEHAQAHNDVWERETLGVAAPMQELVQDDAAMQRVPRADILAAGIPCSGASQAGKSKRGLSMMEDHPEVGHLVASAIMLINRIQPAVCVIENVTQYAGSASAQILRHHLRDCGYAIQEVELDSSEFGSLEKRVRWFMVAATRGLEIDLSELKPALRPVRKIGDVLEPIGPEASDWRSFEYLKAKEVRDAAKGNSFAMQVITPESTSCPTLRKGYHVGGSTDPLLAHPANPDLLRQLTVVEHARIKEVPEHLVQDLSKTDGHALLGQGIAYGPVRALFRRIGQSLMAWKAQPREAEAASVAFRLCAVTG